MGKNLINITSNQSFMTNKTDSDSINTLWAAEAKALVVLAFRNGPIENVHASGRITEDEMKEINKHAVNTLYRLIALKRRSKGKYIKELDFGLRYARNWDDPEEDPELRPSK